MDTINALINSGLFGVIDLVLLGVIGVLVYFVFIKNNNATAMINETVEGLKIQLDDEHKNVEKLSCVVAKVRQELEDERNEKWELKEQVLLLRMENEKLRGMVDQLQQMVDSLKEENARLLKQIQGGE